LGRFSEGAVRRSAGYLFFRTFTGFGEYNSRIMQPVSSTVDFIVRHTFKNVEIEFVSPYLIRIESVKICM